MTGPISEDVEFHKESFDICIKLAARSYREKTEKFSILFMNIQEYSKKFMIFLKLLMSSITLWSQNNDTLSHKKLEKNPGIQARYESYDSCIVPIKPM